MRTLVVLTGLLTIWVVLGTEAASAKNYNFSALSKLQDIHCPGIKAGIKFYRSQTWKHEDLLGKKRTRGRYGESYTRDCTTLQSIAVRWRESSKKAYEEWKAFRKTYEYQLVKADSECVYENQPRCGFHYAVILAEQIYGVSSEWLHACAHDEGGHGRWVWNTQGSKAGGWMQFMEGTLYARVDAAFSYARKKGFNVPSKYRSFYSRVGQAFTAGYMFMIGENDDPIGWAGQSCL